MDQVCISPGEVLLHPNLHRTLIIHYTHYEVSDIHTSHLPLNFQISCNQPQSKFRSVLSSLCFLGPTYEEDHSVDTLLLLAYFA